MRIIAGGASPDPRTTAGRLLATFGSMGSVLAAPRAARLKACDNDTAAVAELDAFRAAMLHALRQEVERRPVISTDRDLERYLTGLIGFARAEQVVVLFLNARQRLLADEVMFVGSVDNVQVPVREVMVRALDLGAAGIILVHNHPSGDPTPTESDLALTEIVARAAALLGIRLLDHMIVAAGRMMSLRRQGLLACG